MLIVIGMYARLDKRVFKMNKHVGYETEIETKPNKS